MYPQGGVSQRCIATERNSAGMLREEAQHCTEGRSGGSPTTRPMWGGASLDGELVAENWEPTGSHCATDP